ncbi:AEC family transporter [Gammaproteobacteria bacterium]|nr:AEC family transporter [Gammaproteobacteria bacterium]
MQSASISVVFPLIAVMLSGYLVGRFKLLPENGSKVISRFVFLVAMPALIFISLAGIPVNDFFNWTYLAVLGGGMLAIYLLAILVARYAFTDSLTAHSLHALTAMFASTAYIGLPLILILFGEAGLVPGIIGAVITGAVFMPMTIILAEIDKGRTGGKVVVASVVAVIQSPLLIATVAGLLTSASGIGVAQPVAAFFQLLGDAFIPCALFSAGLFISQCSVKGEVKEISWLVFAKLLLHPLITWWLAFYVFELEGILPVIAVLQAALPSGVPVFVLAQHYGTFVSQSSAVIVLSTVISLLTLPVVMILLA